MKMPKAPWKCHESAMKVPWICHQSAVWWQIHGTLMALSTKQSSKQCRFMAFSWHFTLETIFSSFDRWSKSTTNSKRNIPIVLPLIQKYGWLTYPLIWVVVSNIFYFHPYLGGWSNLTNIFEMGWNHQLVIDWLTCLVIPPQKNTSWPTNSSVFWGCCTGSRGCWHYSCGEAFRELKRGGFLREITGTLLKYIYKYIYICIYTSPEIIWSL